MESDPDLLADFRHHVARAIAQWRPGPEAVHRFHVRLQTTLERVKADGSPLTLIEQTGSAIADAETPFEAFAHLAMLEVYAKTSTNERLLRYCKLVADVFRLLGEATRAQSGRAELTADEALADLRLAGKMIAAVATMDRDEPRLADERLLAFASSGRVEADIAGLVLQMLADLRGEVPS